MRAFRIALAALGLVCALRAQEQLTLDKIVAETLERNVGLMAERANIAVAEARIITARLRPNPVFSVYGSHVDMLGTGFNDLNAGGPTEINFHTDYTIERGGKRQARTEVAQAARSVTEQQYLNVVRSVVLDVENAFVDVLLARDSLALARQNMDSLNQIVDINAARLKAGDISEVELIRARLAALQYANSVRLAELRLRNALTRLQTAMGRPRPSLSFDVVGDLRRDQAVPDLDELQRTAAEQRPDVRALVRDVERAEAEYRSQVAQGKVDFTVGTEYTRQQVNANSNSLGFVFNTPLPIFNRNQGEIERARQEQHQAELRVRAARVALAGEVETAYQQHVTARDLLDNIEKKMLQPSRDVREITEFSYKRGDATLLELLDAQRAYNETMQGYIEARADYARSLYLLDSISGKAVTK